jgi:hypothetical protein
VLLGEPGGGGFGRIILIPRKVPICAAMRRLLLPVVPPPSRKLFEQIVDILRIHGIRSVPQSTRQGNDMTGYENMTTEGILSQIEKLQAVQKGHPMSHKAWQTASELLAPLFQEMARRQAA